MTDIFGRGNIYAEIQRHRDRDEEARNQAVIALARSMQVPSSCDQRGLSRRSPPRVKSSMSSPACITRSPSLQPASCSPETPSAT